MANRIITFCYRKIIDTHAEGAWEKMVFNDTYSEFLLQAQNFNPEKKHTTFSSLLRYVPESVKLHYLVSAAAVGYLQQLNERVPDILNILGRQFLTFKSFHFEIINSDLTTAANHQVAINFYSEPMIWHDSACNYMLVSAAHNLELPVTGDEQETYTTDMVQLQPFFTIQTLKKG